MATNIQVYVRVRPSAKPSSAFHADTGKKVISFTCGKNQVDGEVNNNKQEHTFCFNGILDMRVSQQEVFDKIVQPIINDVLGGVNGTIFAYGQTGSGKTFTITGGADRYDDRGLIPRTLSYMFERFRRSEAQHKMYISYLEIYQDKGYDLLRGEDAASRLEDLPQVQMRQDADGGGHLRNLSVNVATSCEEALNLLFLGDTNRVVAETPMNDASTRSHCLFIIWVETVSSGSDVVLRSKLHLVDLAGSERPSQTGVQGKLLREATSINQSLHFLERVIVALHARSKGEQVHVPYRDSMMTLVLRDSLGGNCKTSMVACVASETSNIPESVSTCRFAQRVGQIQNNAKVNEELDPGLLIARLRREVSDLKAKLSGQSNARDFTQLGEEVNEDFVQCQRLVEEYIRKDIAPRPASIESTSLLGLRTCFRILRNMCNGSGLVADTASVDSVDPAAKIVLESELRKFQLERAQRDQEISMMVRVLSKGQPEEPQKFLHHLSESHTSIQIHPPDVRAETPPARGTSKAEAGHHSERANANSNAVEPHAAYRVAHEGSTKDLGTRNADDANFAKVSEFPDRQTRSTPSNTEAAEMLLDQGKAFEFFRATVYRQPASAIENTTLLKDKISCAKKLGEEAATVRAAINKAKTQLERLRTERAMTAAGTGCDSRGDPEYSDGPEELTELQEMERLRVVFREKTTNLRQVKGEVEMIQRLLQQAQLGMRKEFEAWFASLRKRVQPASLDQDTKRNLYEKITGISAPAASSLK